MMGLTRPGLVLALVGLWMVPAMAQTRGPRCLHGDDETDVQGQRRVEALNAADLINRLIDRRPRKSEYPTWEELGKSPMVASYRGMAGPRGDLVRKIQWGADQPLPGWQIHYVAAQDGYAFSLTDLRDPCSLTFASNDTGMLIQGRPADRHGPARVIPLDSTH
jgi:hypothetical protein